MADSLSAQNNSNQTKIWTDKNIFAKSIKNVNVVIKTIH